MIADSDGISLFSDYIILFILFLVGMDVLDFAGLMIAGAIFLFFFLHFTELSFDGNTGILVLFSAFYFASVGYYEGVSLDGIIKYAIAPWGCYMIGYNILLKNRSISVTDFATLVAFGFFLHGMLNLYSSIKVFGASFNNNYRQAYDFWQGRTISVTTASLYYTPFILMAIGLLFFSSRKIVRLLSPVAILLGLYSTMIYQNRTLLLACALVVGLNILLVLIDPDMPQNEKLIIYIIIAGAVFAVLIAFLADLGGIRSTIMESSLMNRMTDSKQDRTTIWLSFILGEAWKYPFGGTKAVLYGDRHFVHNTWLDTFRRGGFLPFLFLIIFTLRSVSELITFKSRGRLTGEDTGAVISLMVGVILSFMVEPVIEANPYIFYLPLLVMGAVSGYNKGIRSFFTDVLVLYYASAM